MGAIKPRKRFPVYADVGLLRGKEEPAKTMMILSMYASIWHSTWTVCMWIIQWNQECISATVDF